MCISILLTGDKSSIDAFNWHLSQGYAVVDRFDLGMSFVLILKKA